MHLKNLNLIQFRNFRQQELALSPRLNVFVGPNGSGKSNCLEAVHVLASGRSHRGADAKHLIQWQTDGFSLKGEFEEAEETLRFEVKQPLNRAREIRLNGRPCRRLKEWVGLVPIVAFSPDDLNWVKGEPVLRRKVANDVLSQVDVHYLEALQMYGKIVTERNAALRRIQEGELSAAELDPWDLSLLKYGMQLSVARKNWIREFSVLVNEKHNRLSGRKERIELVYKPAFSLEGTDRENQDRNHQRIRELRDAEIALGATLKGPHRDDIDMVLDGSAAKHYASQGQQRTVALAVVLAQRDYLAQRLGRWPVCLLDDVFSELDQDRRAELVAFMSDMGQCLITVTSVQDWPSAVPMASLYEVREGRIRSTN
ncbi:MAG TPA: DNA replication/repair protein RecF [Elusimicrobiota bacterium]|nr:DNA replication/repair protein RecF [Elusimicrobiota bacterium]